MIAMRPGRRGRARVAALARSKREKTTHRRQRPRTIQMQSIAQSLSPPMNRPTLAISMTSRNTMSMMASIAWPPLGSGRYSP